MLTRVRRRCVSVGAVGAMDRSGSSYQGACTLALLVLSVLGLCLESVEGVATTPGEGDTVADLVVGQGGSFTSGTQNLGGISGASLFQPYGLALDASGNLYVADSGNNRVLEFDSPLTTDLVADRVVGQAGDFSTGDCKDTVSAASLCFPSGVDVDENGNLYVADTGNHRVLGYITPLSTDTVADIVFGQGDSFTSNSLQGCFSANITAASLCYPWAAVADASGNVYVVDSYHSRVLEYDSPWTTDKISDRVYGQGGDFTKGGCNSVGTNAGSLCYPRQLGMDSSGNLYVGDTSNHRVLRFDSPLLDGIADYVFGQRGSFTTRTCGLPGTGEITADTLCDPWQPFVDPSGRLLVGDIAPSRVVEYEQPSSDWTADRVFGQGGDFTTNSCNKGGIGANTLCYPHGVVVDESGNVYVADSDNHRILVYEDPHAISDKDNDGVSGTVEFACGSDPLNASSLPERVDTPEDDDGDTQVNEALPPGAGAYDCDGDGFIGSAEAVITTGDQDPCGGNGWPTDLTGDNKLNIADFTSFVFPLRPDGSFNYFNHTVPDPNITGEDRWNLDIASGAGFINIADLNALNPAVNAPTSRPPMFGGQPAFFTNLGECPWPP